MNNKTYSKIRRKKSFASLILAFLLMFTFNSSPIILMSNNVRNSNAYKSSETKTYYTSKTNESETKFSDPNYPSSYKDYFADSNKNFNILTYYNTNFEKLFFKYTDEFFKAYDVDGYNTKYEEFLDNYDAENLSEFFTAQKNEPLLKANLFEVTPRELVAHMAFKGFEEYTEGKSLPPVSNLIAKYKNLSNFYRLLANYTINDDYDIGEAVDNEQHTNNEITNDEAFYKKPTSKDREENKKVGNSHYNRFVDYVDAEIAKTAPLYAFDKETQDTNIAAIFANLAPTDVEYNYISNSYVSYNEPSVNFKENEHPQTKVKSKTIYYFGTAETLRNEFPACSVTPACTNSTVFDDLCAGCKEHRTYIESVEGYLSYVAVGDKAVDDIFLYRPIQPTDAKGYNSKFATYYKYTSSPYLTTSSKRDIYVLSDNETTQDDLDTLASIHFKELTQSEYTKNKDYYVQIPYEDDKLYFKAAYNDVWSSKGFFGANDDEKFDTFVSTFTDLVNMGGTNKRVSKLYVKVGTTTKKTVYIDKTKIAEFKTANAGYAYNVEPINTLDDTAPDFFKAADYEKILKNSNNSAYFVEGYDLYFEKTKEYYTEPAAPTLDTGYETTYAPKIPIETEKVASTKFETELNERKIFLVSDSTNPTETIKSIDETIDYEFSVVSQETVDSNADLYVAVPSYIYNDKNISDTYKLYYKHTEVDAKKLYIVDDSDNAADNAIYKTLNFNVIKSTELKSNITNYVAVKEGDANYNKNFQLYYKYVRTSIDTVTYVLSGPGISLVNNDLQAYKLVNSNQLSDYVYLEKEDHEALYTAAAGVVAGSNEFKLYHKLSNVFVQNNLKGGNAVYVLDTSVSKDEKETYSRLMYTPVTQKEIDNNPSLFVLIDSNDESNYFADYKLYYKYQTESTPKRVVYSYEDIDQSVEDFSKECYELITSGDDYKAGQELYYKRKVLNTNKTNITKPTFYYYQTTSTTTLSANSYYVVSFYVNTISVNDEARASLQIRDTAGVIDNINVNNINTNGVWEKYYVYLSTNANTSSTINIYLYLGDDEHGIKGDTSSTEITGSVFFDEIKITKIGLTDFTKYAIDEVAIYSESTQLKDSSGDPVTGKYADEYNNPAYVANTETSRFNTENWDARKYLNVDAYNGNKFNDIFNFDDENLQNFLGKDTGVEADKKANELEVPTNDIDGFDMYTPSFNKLWRYYISRDLENDFSIDNFINAYQDGKLEVTTTNKIEEPEEPDEDEDEDEEKDDDKKDEADKSDIKYVSSPFNTNNFALKLKNTSRDTALGITSNSFKVKQFEYYRINLWVYSPNIEGRFSVSVNSVLTDRQHPTYGSLLSAATSTTYANIENSTSSTSEYGWIPVSIYIEGNNFQDMDCYLVLTADKDSTVYFDNIKIEKTTSAQYDSAKSKSSSDNYICALSLTPSSSLISSDLTNGTFDYIKESTMSHDVTSAEPFEADNWTLFTTNSTRTVSGVVSLQQDAFFEKYSKNSSSETVIPEEYTGDISNIFAIYAPSKVEPFNTKVYTPAEIALDTGDLINYKHTYSLYSASLSLSANTLYKISFKFFKNDNFSGKIISNIYNSAVKTANIIATLDVNESDFEDEKWHTLTYYIATSTSSQTVYLEIGVEEASGTCFFKSAAAKKLTGKTIDSVIQSEATKLGISNTATETLYDAFKTIRFLNLANADLSYHSTTINPDTNFYDSNAFTNKSDVTTDHTAGKIGVTVASYFDTINHTLYSTTINKVNYYIGEVYELELDETKYYVHKTYNSAKNEFNYTMYSDSTLKTEVTKINGKDFEILTTGEVKVKIDGTEHSTETTYRLFKFSDLREEITEIDGQEVNVPNLETVLVGKGAHETENAITSAQNISYVYHFGTPTQKDYEFNNNIISAKELQNAQSGNVMILSNSHSTDYITLTQSSLRTLGKSTFNVLRIYVKTSDFKDDTVGLNIKVSAVNVEWKNIDTTKSTQKDEYGFVCYEILVSSNSTDSVSNFGVEFTLGNTDKSEVGYAIISKVSLDAISTKEEFEHYSALVGDDNENIKKAIYTDAANDSTTNEEEEADDKNSISWATFFYIFSSVLLVVTLAVAMVAVFLKKHPIKVAEKFENDHERDIQTTNSKSKKTSTEKTPLAPRTKKSKKDEIVIDLSNTEEKKPKKGDGEII